MARAKKPSLFIIDGSNNVYRSYYAIRNLTNSAGFSTNAVYGFVTTLRKLLKDHDPDCIAVAFDEGQETARSTQYEDYKKDRKPMPDDLVVQMPLVYEVLEGFHIPIIRSSEWEADDFIGSLACTARDRGYDVVIATSDKDFFQLVGDGIRFYHTGRETLYDAKGVEEAFGLPPEKVVDVMAIWGDSIDNIPGVPGIGEKGAKGLIQQFGSLEDVYAHLDEVAKPAMRKKLEEHRDKAFLSRDLARIKCDLTLDIDFETLKRRDPDRAKLHDVFSRLEFASLMQEFLPAAPEEPKEYRIATAPEEIQELVNGADAIALWVEPRTIEGFDAPIAASLSVRNSESLIVPLTESFGGNPELASAFREVLGSDRLFITYDAKAQSRRLRAAGWPVPARWADVMLMSYVLNPGLPSHALANIARDRLKQDVAVRKDVQKTAPLFALDHELGSSPLSPYQQYLGDKSDLALALHAQLEPELRRDDALADIYERIEMPLFPVLASLEERGIRVDVSLLDSMSKTMGATLAELEAQIYKEAGQEFNINSPLQLGQILFEKLQYPVIKKTKTTKSYSTSVEVLEELASHGFVVPQLILQHRELHKLKGTYIDALPQLVGADGRVHTTFNQAVAATGRLSSSDPNLQNIPIRTQTGREIRKAFVADEGSVLLSADYSQVELRILAHMSQDESLIETFRRGDDIHRATASKMFDIPPQDLTAEQRRAAKVINFGVLYGMSAFRLSNELSISTAQAKDWIDAYFSRYPKIQEYLDRTLDEARSSGKVTTLFGRVRYIPEIHNRSFTVRGNAERMAINAPIQGTAADLLKLAMIALEKKLSASAARMLLTVHDEIVIEAPESAADDVAGIVKDTMESIYPLAVPLAVDAHWGKSWYDAKE
ncbi:MAG: DNA polymerase I [Acidobacteria bacterium]|nr:DNA polymerase I [Acidobacteriota bacterium]MBV9477191.1 DNA polymerase I [Acidobacteriota bacterium]